MKDFTITEDFPKNEIEFDKRFSDPAACYDYQYLFKLKWPNGFICNAATGNTGSHFPHPSGVLSGTFKLNAANKSSLPVLGESITL